MIKLQLLTCQTQSGIIQVIQYKIFIIQSLSTMISFNEEAERKTEVSRKTQIILALIDQALQSLKKDSLNQSNNNYIQRISLNLEQTKIEMVLYNLTKGYIVKKHSASVSEFHSKFLYLSDDHRFLCWKSLEKNDEKKIELSKIESILTQKNCSYLVKSSTLKNYDESMVIKSSSRNLEIECSSAQECLKIAEEINEAIRNSRRLHLSYKF